MDLRVKSPEHLVPSYSLTADLLSYSRCRLQYRYHNGSSLPPSRPVQLWYGEFLHGTMELAYSYWSENVSLEDPLPDFPWPCTMQHWQGEMPEWVDHDIGRFAHQVEEVLRHQGKQARSTAARNSAYERVEAAVNLLGSHLFPLISAAEQKVIGTRPIGTGSIPVRCEDYEVRGIIDVLTNVTLSSNSDGNVIREYLANTCPELQGDYEVIVDYKGTRRPLMDEPDWDQGDWQIQTYAWLRQRQAGSRPVAAGILFYINELAPGQSEIHAMRRGMDTGLTDVTPVSQSDSQLIRMWRPGNDGSELSLEFRLNRALRVIPVTDKSTGVALNKFDGVVRRIEEDIANEVVGRDILRAWSPDCRDPGTCVACDFRHFCPSPCDAPEDYQVKAPRAP